ncbi:MAG TPA: ribonuclease P protein component [Candidatus Dormibacteraeota bacterium]
MKQRYRLRRRSDFQRVLQAGRLYAGPTLVAFATPGSSAESRVGVTVSRQVGGAVHRNRLRRRLREVARTRLLRDDSPLVAQGIKYDVVLIARPAALTADVPRLEKDAEAFLRRLAGRRPEAAAAP